jgi:hypothetical protein
VAARRFVPWLLHGNEKVLTNETTIPLQPNSRPAVVEQEGAVGMTKLRLTRLSFLSALAALALAGCSNEIEPTQGNTSSTEPTQSNTNTVEQSPEVDKDPTPKSSTGGDQPGTPPAQ